MTNNKRYNKRPRNKCKRGHFVEGENAYKRANGYLECRRCRDLANKRLTERVQREPVTMELIRRFAKVFWSHVKKSSDCWMWQGAPCGRYGRFSFAGYSFRPNRFALALKLGRLPNGLACHTCDTPMCVRKNHLYEGTAVTNACDSVVRGRAACGERNGNATMPWRRPRGTRHGMAKLNEDEVRSIRELHATKTWRWSDLAKRFGVSLSNVKAIVLRKKWRHVP